MVTALIKNLSRHAGQEVTIQGWVYNLRSSGKIAFLIIRDGSGLMQGVVAKQEVGEALFGEVKKLTQESAVKVTGMVREEPRSVGGYEMQVTAVEIVSIAADYPITHKEHGVDFLAEHRHLWIRTPRQAAVLRIRSEIEHALRNFFYERDFVLADAPIITPAACEGTTNLFEIDYHGEKGYLSQSGQLYSEANAMALGRIYCFGPTFRAEKSKTRRHLLEFWMIEAEMAYFDIDANMQLQEEMIVYVVQRVLVKCQNELKTLDRDVEKLKAITLPFPRISYTDAVDILKQAGEEFTWGEDFGAPHETIISSHFNAPVFVHRYPTKIKAFYMKPDPDNLDVVLGADLLAPEGYGEIIGGGQRIDDLALLEARIAEHKLPKEAFEWYLDLRRFGTVPHSGFGLGLERTVAWLCGLEHIRETIPFPRMLHKMYP
ncbi:asparagine--tRNA ligase [Sporomusa malonica]|uniref:Asparagine--tRNA ligase n=1 Tax=Sporomusa malonica TaxID=112901 RepID=A0A1W2BW62_9FIRM|nr:asparagine--tRNA ligase [Sporomusa malonica]SMC76842.1 asparaginyl-tRNA synthetase [Sporomusa malonica]